MQQANVEAAMIVVTTAEMQKRRCAQGIDDMQVGMSNMKKKKIK